MSDTPEFLQAFVHVFGGDPRDNDLPWRIDLVRNSATRLQVAQMEWVERLREKIEAANAVAALERHHFGEDDPVLKEARLKEARLLLPDARRRLDETKREEDLAHKAVTSILEAQQKVIAEAVVAAAYRRLEESKRERAERAEREAKKVLRAAE